MTYTEHLTPDQVHELYAYYGTMPAYVWPGGYPLVYMYDMLDDNETLDVCAKCANDAETSGNVGVKLAGAFIHFEGAPITCYCSAQIESAYGEVPAEPSGQLINGVDY